jgi:tetratricopeptide (TPR) repeat protein
MDSIVLRAAAGYSGAMIRLLEWLLERLFSAFMKPIMKKARDHGREMGRNNPRAVPEIMLNLYRTGDYQNALAMCHICGSAGQDLEVFRAHLLMQTGQAEEAVRILTQEAPRQKSPQLAALAHCTLGEVYLIQYRLDAALAAFQTALKLWPERAAIERNLAEVWLRRGDREETLRCARLGVERENASPGLTPETKAANLAVGYAVLACAVAASTGEVSEVWRLTSEAAGQCGGIAVSPVAQTHLYCGIAYRVVGDAGKSAEHFERATRVDPHGAWGREAERLMAEVVPAR